MSRSPQHSPGVSAPGHLAFLDGLRGFAALYVLVGHCMMWGGFYSTHLPDPAIAVDVFMIMSGYLMVHNWKPQNTSLLAYSAEFWLKRFFRIAPLYYLALGLTFLFSRQYCNGLGNLANVTNAPWIHGIYRGPEMASHFTVASLVAHLSFAFGALPKYSISTYLPDWSIGLEMQFYAAFPLLIVLFRRFGYLPVCTVSLAICLVAQQLWLGPVFVEPSLLVLKLPMFLIGMLLADANRTFSADKPKGTCLLLLAIAVGALSRHTIPSIIILVTCAIFALVSASENALFGSLLRHLNRLLANQLTAFLADMSYSVYLSHLLFMSFLGGDLLFRMPSFLQLHPATRVAILVAVTAAGAYGCGSILSRLVEKPGIAFGRELIARSRRIRMAVVGVPRLSSEPAPLLPEVS